MMNRVGTYLNFSRSTEDAFSFYRSVFHTEFSASMARLNDTPPHWMFSCANKARPTLSGKKSVALAVAPKGDGS